MCCNKVRSSIARPTTVAGPTHRKGTHPEDRRSLRQQCDSGKDLTTEFVSTAKPEHQDSGISITCCKRAGSSTAHPTTVAELAYRKGTYSEDRRSVRQQCNSGQNLTTEFVLQVRVALCYTITCIFSALLPNTARSAPG